MGWLLHDHPLFFIMKKSVLIIILLLFILKGYSQECGTVATSEQLEFMQQIQFFGMNGNSSRTKASLVRIPIKFHSVRPSDGSGGLTPSQATSILAKSNAYYQNAGIEFFQFGEINFINDDLFYNLNSANEGGLAVPNDVPFVINLYLMNSLQSNGIPLCGYTRFPPSSDRVFSTYSCALNGTTVEHELGHYFTLFHTHGKTNTGTTDELVNGTNCNNAGDNICDTPADPNLSGRVTTGCIYTGTGVDANGQSYQPDVSNVMSYSRDQCTNRFSAGQYERIRNGYENGRNYLLVETPGFSANFFATTRKTCRTGTINFTPTGSGATSWSWEFPGGTPSESTSRTPQVRYDQSGTFTVRLRARAANGDVVNVEKTDFINIEDPLDGARTSGLNLTIDGVLPLGFTTSNPDQSITFAYSPIDKAGNSNSGSILVNNYNYQADQPVNYDYLFTPFFNTTGVKKYAIEFDVSYTSRKGETSGDFVGAERHDSLAISVNTKCGVKPLEIWKRGGEALQTVPSMIEEFSPTSGEDWDHITIDVNITDGEYAQLSFISSSRNGNNLFIDNLSITPDYSLIAPNNFRTTQSQPGNVILRWLDNSTNEVSFLIKRSVNNSDFEDYIVLPKNTQQFTDTNTESGNLYAYQLLAKGFEENTSLTVGPVIVDQLLVSNVVREVYEKKYLLYPNPAASKIFIVSKDQDYIKSVEVLDNTGKSLIRKTPNDLTNTYELDVTELQSGLYIVNIQSVNDNRNFIRLIKN